MHLGGQEGLLQSVYLGGQEEPFGILGARSLLQPSPIHVDLVGCGLQGLQG